MSLIPGGDRKLVKTKTGRIITPMRIKTTKPPNTNNTACSRSVLVADRGNSNGSKNLVMSGDNTLRTSNNTLEAGGGIYMGSKYAPVAARNYAMGFTFLPLAGMSSTTGSSNLQLAGGKFVGSKDAPIVARSYTMGSQFLHLVGVSRTIDSSNL